VVSAKLNFNKTHATKSSPLLTLGGLEDTYWICTNNLVGCPSDSTHYTHKHKHYQGARCKNTTTRHTNFTHATPNGFSKGKASPALLFYLKTANLQLSRSLKMSQSPYISPPRTILQAYRSLPEGTLAQLIQNQIIMSPAPLDRHQRISMELSSELVYHVKRNKLGTVRYAPYDVYLDLQNAFQPDIIFISNEQKHLIDKDGFYGAPALVIEILSPSTAKYDLEEKKDIYERYGVKEYWIVDPADGSVVGYASENNKFVTLPATVGKIESTLLDWKVEFD
jgi:Uma2 family endonuclease